MRFGNLNGGMSQDSFIKLIHLLNKYVCVFADMFSYYFILSQIKYLLNVFSV